MNVKSGKTATVIGKTLSCRKFDADPKSAREAAVAGPVFIAQGGYHAFALITIQEYRRLGGRAESILDLLAMPEDLRKSISIRRVWEDEPVRAADFFVIFSLNLKGVE